MTTPLTNFYNNQEYEIKGSQDLTAYTDASSLSWQTYTSNKNTGLDYSIKGYQGTYDGSGYVVTIGDQKSKQQQIMDGPVYNLNYLSNMLFYNGTVAVEFYMSGNSFLY